MRNKSILLTFSDWICQEMCSQKMPKILDKLEEYKIELIGGTAAFIADGLAETEDTSC